MQWTWHNLPPSDLLLADLKNQPIVSSLREAEIPK